MPCKIKSTDFSGQTFYVGLDVHKKSWTVTIRTLDFEVAHFTQPAQVDQLSNYLRYRYPGASFFSAYEAGFCGTGIHDQLCAAGICNIIIHPADLPQTNKQKNNKTDIHDSRATARYLEAGGLKGIYIMRKDQQQRRSLFRLRQSKVRDVTRCNNRLRSLLNYFGVHHDALCNNEYLSNKILTQLYESSASLAGEAAMVMQQQIEELIYQRKQLSEITKKLKLIITRVYQEEYNSLISVPGIGTILATALLAEIGDFNRFNNDDEYCSYLGIVPCQRSSGDNVYYCGMQSRCNKHLRPLLIEAAWQAIRKSPTLLQYYRKHIGSGNKKAIVKVAAKLALIAKAVAIKEAYYVEKE